MTKTSSRQLFVAFAFCFVSTAPAHAQLTTLGAVVLNGCPVPGDCGTNDLLGWALASGDFNGDGFADLAVGIPFEDESGDANTGAVQIFYGSVAGLSAAATQVFDQASAGISGAREPDDRFGWALAVGDFGPDGFDDLVIGIPNEGIGSVDQAGAIEILFGSSTGLTTTGSRFYSQDNLPPGSGESAEFLDHFGFALAAAPDGEIAVGVPGECFILPNECGAGLVQLISPNGAGVPFELSFEREQNDFLDECGALDGNELNDAWGSSLVYLGTSVSSWLAVAGEREGFSGLSFAGRVTTQLGSLEACFDQNTTGVQETAEDDDFFGRALAAGNLTGDSFDDLLIGVPFEDLAAASGGQDAGVVQVFLGTFSGFSTVGDLLLRQADFPLGQETGDSEDQFGSALAGGDFDGDGFGDVAIGAPGEDGDRGRAHIAYGDGDGINTLFHQTFHSDFPSAMPDTAEAGDRFGQALAAGDFDGNGTADLAIGMPGEGVSGVAGTGALTILYGLDRATGGFGAAQFTTTQVTFPEVAGSRTLLVARSGGAPVAASVDRVRQGGTATLGADLNYTNGSESWALGELGLQPFFVQILEDTLDEDDETMVLALTNPSPGLALGDQDTITITIQDDDEGGVVQFSAPALGVLEAVEFITVTIQRTGGAASGVSVAFTTVDGSAVAGQDYQATSGSLFFGANVGSRSFQVPIVDDPGDEFTESFSQ